MTTATQADDSEAINSDLDDSDSDNEQDGNEGGSADTDIVFCTYDKVCSFRLPLLCACRSKWAVEIRSHV